MKFYNRTVELQELQTLDKARPSLLVITGKRRVGKTELILHYLAGSGLYFFVDHKKNEAILVKEFLEEVKRKYAVPDYLGEITSLENFLSLLFDLAQKQDITAVFDEFQRFAKMNLSIVNQFQKKWDMKHRQARLFMIISGSSVGMIKKLFIQEEAPLFKRADNIMYLEPFSFAQTTKITADLGVKDFQEQLQLYFMFGGVIYYYKLLEKYGVRSFEEAIERLVVREFAPLQQEVREILMESFGKEHRTYYEILNALALGKNTKKEMSDSVGVEETSLSPYLQDLRELVKVIEYRLPLTEDQLKSKKGRYCLTDNFFIFWFTFIFRNANYYEQKNYDLLKSIIMDKKEEFFGKMFESFSREVLYFLNQKKKAPFSLELIGNWWGHYRDSTGVRQEVEIDLCAINKLEKKILFGECKWREKVSAPGLLNILREKTKYVSWYGENREEYYVLFAKSFKDKEKIQGKDIFLFDLNDLEKIFMGW